VWAAVASDGRTRAPVNRYPDATRGEVVAKLRLKFIVLTRFGTEGSEVQILSPRPLSSQNPKKI
jgi:hypothetical protein